MTGPSTTSSQTTQAEGPLLRPDEAAHLLSVKTSWVYEAVRAGRGAMRASWTTHSFHASHRKPSSEHGREARAQAAGTSNGVWCRSSPPGD
jgi:hypothetical protein